MSSQAKDASTAAEKTSGAGGSARLIDHRISARPATGGSRRLPVFNPATGRQSAEVCVADAATVDAAVRAAADAWPQWKDTSAQQRARVLFRFKALVEEHMDELAAMITHEHGKTLNDARGELMRGIEVIEFACAIPQLLKGQMSDNIGGNIDNWSVRQPLGVCAGITPFNFPAMVPLWMFPVAIACGNTFVLKPSEKDPSPSLLFSSLLADSGLPDGVFNVLQGDRETVDALLDHEQLAAVSFVGSTPVAEHVFDTCRRTGKRVQALGGAKNHMLIMPDAELDLVTDALMGAGYGSAGERCMAISVAVAVGDIADPLVEKLAAKISMLKVNEGTADDADMGPLITREHRDRVLDYIESGISEGARLVVDGRGCEVAGHEDGFFLGPSLFDQVDAQMRIYREEIFGPVLVVMRVPDLAAGLQLINAHEYGNGVACFTNDARTARTFSQQVQAGMVGINIPLPVPMAYHSFGGWKRSLFGDMHIYGEEGVRFYTRYKSIMQRWPDTDSKGPEFIMPTHR